MPKPLMPYGSNRHSTLIVKDQGKDKRVERPNAQLASNALSGSGGHLTKGGAPGGGKEAVGTLGVSGVVRLNARKA